MYYRILIFGMAFLMNTVANTATSPLEKEGEWHFIAIHHGVKFYWKEDPSWHHIYIKTENPTEQLINYTYQYEILQDGSVVEQGKHSWYGLRSKDKNEIKIAKGVQGANQVRLKEIKVERYR